MMKPSANQEQAMGAAVAYSAYRAAEIATLSPRDLLVKLHEGMERFLEAGAAAIEQKQWESAQVNCRRLRDIVFELQSTLNFDAGGEIAQRLDGLYRFLIVEITESQLGKDAARLRQLRRVITPLRQGWQQVPDAHARTSSLGQAIGGNVVNCTG